MSAFFGERDRVKKRHEMKRREGRTAGRKPGRADGTWSEWAVCRRQPVEQCKQQ